MASEAAEADSSAPELPVNDATTREPKIPVKLDIDIMFGLRKAGEKFGRQLMTQQALKVYQALPIAWAALAINESPTMPKAARNIAMSNNYMNIACPAFISLCIMAESNGVLFPLDFKNKMYFTTLGTGKNPPKTFAQLTETIRTKFSAIKAEFMKGPQFWFDTHGNVASDLPSGFDSTDALKMLEKAMYMDSPQAKKLVFDAASESLTPVLTSNGPAAMEGLSSEEGRVKLEEGRVGSDSSRGDSLPGKGTEEAVVDLEMPDDWVYPYILLVCAWTPWSDNFLREWKPLVVSGGPKKRKKSCEENVVSAESPLSSPAAVPRHILNANGRRRREHNRALVSEKGHQAAQEQADSGMGQIVEPRTAGLVAMEQVRAPSNPKERKKLAEKNRVSLEDSIGTPATISSFTPNNNAMSHRKLNKAAELAKDHHIKEHNNAMSHRKLNKAAELAKDHHIKEQADNKSKQVTRELIEMGKAGLVAIEQASAHAANIGASMTKMVALKEKEAILAARAAKILALEKKLELGFGNPETVKAELERTLDEQC